MSALSFVRANATWLGAGALMTASTGFGQTFFISLYADEWRAAFDLSHGDWGAIYMVATLASAAVLTQAGRLADVVRARTLSLILFGVFALVCVGVSFVSHWIMLAFLVFGLRFCGQGMLGHLAITSMGKWFRAGRARAVAVASLGFSIGEAILPAAAILVIAAFGWRASWLMAAAMLVLVVAPATFWLLRRERSPQSMAESVVSPGMDGRHWTRGEMARHWMFWALLPGLIAPGWIGTTIFFQIRHLTEIKGWDVLAYAALAYPAYSVVTIAASFAFGIAVDRFGAMRFLPVYLLGWAAGAILMGLAGPLWLGVVALGISGVGSGGVSVVVIALTADLYGTRWLGGVKAILTALMVLASALGPGVSGALLDAGVGFEVQCLFMGGFLVAVSLWFAVVAARGRTLIAAPT
ncbi:MAG: MFS transporter [Pseudomonadota bacterium]